MPPPQHSAVTVPAVVVPGKVECQGSGKINNVLPPSSQSAGVRRLDGIMASVGDMLAGLPTTTKYSSRKQW